MPIYDVTVTRTATYRVTVDGTQEEPRELAEDYARQLFDSDSPGGQTASTTIQRTDSSLSVIARRIDADGN
jgi:hypothetical protein